jgi:hypothetical protein
LVPVVPVVVVVLMAQMEATQYLTQLLQQAADMVVAQM